MTRAGIRKKKRQSIYERDGFQCVYCKSQDSLTLDHLRPKSAVWDDSRSYSMHSVRNLVTSCLTCNSSRQNSSVRSFCIKTSLKTGEPWKTIWLRVLAARRRIPVERESNQADTDRGNTNTGSSSDRNAQHGDRVSGLRVCIMSSGDEVREERLAKKAEHTSVTTPSADDGAVQGAECQMESWRRCLRATSGQTFGVAPLCSPRFRSVEDELWGSEASADSSVRPDVLGERAT